MTKHPFAALAFLIALSPVLADAQSVTCSPKDFRPSLVRIERAGSVSGTGIVIIRRDTYAIVLTAGHVMPRRENFRLIFQVAPDRPHDVRWTEDMLIALPTDTDLIAFRVDVPVPTSVVPEDPFEGEVRDGWPMMLWGYPSAAGATLCSYEGRLLTTDSGQLAIGAAVPKGVSGGPAFYVDEFGASKLAGIVTGTGASPAVTEAIDIRQAVAIVTTSRDPRDNNRMVVWPNIQLRDKFDVDPLLSFNLVKPTTMEMGNPSGPGNQRPTTTVKLPSYFMGQYEIARGHYHECVTKGPCSYARPTPPPKPSEISLPVTNVTWHQASEFARWLQGWLLSRRETPITLRRLIDAGWRLDLPSESEWERAARKDGKAAYPWGDSSNQPDAWYNTGRPRAVDASKCDDCEAGLFDMAGNVREWTRSLMRPYPYDASAADQPNAPGGRVVRGGSYKEMPNPIQARQTIRGTNRDQLAPTQADEFTGVRVALICDERGARPCRWRDPD